MEITLELIVFTVLAVFTAVSALLAVTTKRILRAATYLLFVLFGTAGIYFQLNYSFLGAVQLLISSFRFFSRRVRATSRRPCGYINSSWGWPRRC